MDRRRRAIREGFVAAAEANDDGRVSPTRTARASVDFIDTPKKDRGVAYSHSVRRACQHRLVQFIPIRKLSLTWTIAASVAIPILLMLLHYLVFVNGALAWSRHPMSTLLNANSPRSLAAWLSSHLWLLCLAATVLTFRLRKHKLDDYEGEYRLWFWLVFTCVIGSIDSTTRLTELFSAALDRWSQLHIGWTGGAIVQATLATLVGLLGLRLCTELKSVPASLVLWLCGLACWAASASLSQSLLRIDLSPAARDWLRASLWMGGLTSIWLASLLYLRAVFMEAQQRFLARSVMLAGNAIPWRERLRESMPEMPQMLKNFRRRGEQTLDDEDGQADRPAPRKRKSQNPTLPGSAASSGAVAANLSAATGISTGGAVAASATGSESRADRKRSRDEAVSANEAPAKRRWGLGGIALRPPGASQKKQAARDSASNDNSIDDSRPSSGNDSGDEIQNDYGKRPNWFRRRKATDQGDGSNSQTKQESGSDRPRAEKAGSKPLDTNRQRAQLRDRDERDGDDAAPSNDQPRIKRSLRDRMKWPRKVAGDGGEATQKPKKPAKEKPVKVKPTKVKSVANEEGDSEPTKRSWLKMPKPSMPKIALPKPRLPQLKVPSFRLPPPSASAGDREEAEANSRVPSVNASRPVPNTSGPIAFKPAPQEAGNDSDSARGMSKAERKRLRRMQRDDDDNDDHQDRRTA